jgi:hypothetical protein
MLPTNRSRSLSNRIELSPVVSKLLCFAWRGFYGWGALGYTDEGGSCQKLDRRALGKLATLWSITNHRKQEFNPTWRDETGVSSRGGSCGCLRVGSARIYRASFLTPFPEASGAQLASQRSVSSWRRAPVPTYPAHNPAPHPINSRNGHIFGPLVPKVSEALWEPRVGLKLRSRAARASVSRRRAERCGKRSFGRPAGIPKALR